MTPWGAPTLTDTDVNLVFSSFHFLKSIFWGGFAKFPAAVPMWSTDFPWALDMWSKIPSTQFSNSPFFNEKLQGSNFASSLTALISTAIPEKWNCSPDFFEQPTMGFISSINFRETILQCYQWTNFNQSYSLDMIFFIVSARDNVFLLIHYFRWDKRCMKIEDVVEIQNRTLGEAKVRTSVMTRW